MTENNDADLVIRRRKRRLPERNNRTTKILSFRLSCLFACFFFIYIIGATYSPWAGMWGKSLAISMLESIGGAVAVPLSFLAYVLFGLGTGRSINDLGRQTGGTIALFISFLILTGFMDMAGTTGSSLSPGWLGSVVFDGMIGAIGVLGTTIVGLLLLSTSAFFYGIIPVDGEDIVKFSRFMSSVFSGLLMKIRRIKRSRSIGDDESYLEEDFWDGEEPESRKIVIEAAAEAEEKIEPQQVIKLLRQPKEEPDSKLDQVEEQDDIEVLDALNEELEEEDFTYRHVHKHAPLPMDILGPEDSGDSLSDPMMLRQKGLDIITALASFGVEAELANALEGPSVVQYQIQLAPGVKVSKVAGLSKDIAVAMAVYSLRVEAPIPGTSYVGIEIPNKKRRPVTLRSVMESDEFTQSDSALSLPMGLKIDGSPLVVGLEELPHLLVAGTTGSGKSVFVNSCITAMCATRSPSELRLILIDPKRVEMAMYEKLPHVLAKPIVDPHKAVLALGWAVKEMERRYEVFARSKVKNLEGYNNKAGGDDRLPHIVIVVDELADLMLTASKDVEDYICRLAQMARATGIHLMLATQRPSVNVITGLIKANIPARAAFTLPSQTDSRTIIDVSGAQQLLGKGDMLFTSTRHPKPVRLQAPFIEEEDSFNVINSLREAFGDPKYVELENSKAGNSSSSGDFFDEDRLEEAIRLIMQSGIASASRLQRQMRVGFTRAARMIDTMEEMGIIGPQEGSKAREIYVDEEGAEEIIEKHLH